jgi:hypothetical protein
MYAKTNNANKIMNTNTKKSFCKVCKDAGKTEKEYTSHGLKNEKGDVICPTLLDQNCRYCNNRGHTVKYCPTLEKNKKEDAKQLKKEEHILRNVNFVNKTNTKKNNFFMALCDDTDNSDEEVYKINKKNNKKDEFPPLVSTKKLDKNTNTLCFKNIITITQEKDTKDKADKEEAEIFQRLNIKKIKREEVQVIAAPTEFLQVVTKKRNWADVYSSDEEDEDDGDQFHYHQSKKENKFLSTYKNPYDSDDEF